MVDALFLGAGADYCGFDSERTDSGHIGQVQEEGGRPSRGDPEAEGIRIAPPKIGELVAYVIQTWTDESYNGVFVVNSENGTVWTFSEKNQSKSTFRKVSGGP